MHLIFISPTMTFENTFLAVFYIKEKTVRTDRIVFSPLTSTERSIFKNTKRILFNSEYE